MKNENTNRNQEAIQPDSSAQLQQGRHPSSRKKTFLVILLVIIAAISVLSIWMYYPNINQMIVGTETPTPLPPTQTQTATELPTATTTSTPLPTPTNTPMPSSAFLAVDPQSISPPLSGLGTNIIVLNEDTSGFSEPDFNHPQWYSSEQISQQLGVIIPEPYFATIGPGSATWSMDVPLSPGLYEIFVLDTIYSSAGSLDFQVSLGDTALTPLLGVAHVEYATISGNPPQIWDIWHSIGLYALDFIDILAISTRWEAREMATIVAIDRVLIAQLPDSIQTYYDQLPANSPKYVVDNTTARFETNELSFTRNDLPAWGDEFQMIVNPTSDVDVFWEIPEAVAAGQYDVWVWAPRMEGNAEILYKVLVNGIETQGALVVDTGNMPSNQWVSLGTWNAPSLDGRPIRLALQMKIFGGTLGEIAIDAAAFISRQ